MGLVARAVAGIGLLALGAAGGALLRDALPPVEGARDLRPTPGRSGDAAPDAAAGDARPVRGSAAPSSAADGGVDRPTGAAEALLALEDRAREAERTLALAREELARREAEADAARALAAAPDARRSELERALERAEAEADARGAELERLGDELARERLAAESARLDLEERIAATADELRAARSRLAEREAELAELTDALERARAGAAAAERLRAREAALAAEPRVAALVEELDALWPAREERIPRLEDWLARARAELAELPSLRRLCAELAAELAAGSTTSEAASALRPAVGPEAGWTLTRLERLIATLEDLADPGRGPVAGRSARHGWGVAERLDFARRVADETVASKAAAQAWSEAAGVLARDPRFGGRTLEARVGWLPLGPDPRTGLLEFAALATGEPPRRGDDGRLQLDPDSAAVAVLVPGGRVWLGSQADDRDGPNHDPLAEAADGPVRRVELAPHLIGKHELTQAQWARLTGETPSRYGPGRWGGREVDRSHPVTDVTWDAAVEVLARHGLRLPTEAEWEADARAGTAGPWWTGAQVRSLEGAVNLADAFAARNGGGAWAGKLAWLDDGHTVAAPVDAYRPNPYGLHGVHGNVWEWCADSFAPHGPAPAELERDPRVELDSTTLRVIRGGAFNSNALDARSSHRASNPADRPGAALGLRIAADAPLAGDA